MYVCLLCLYSFSYFYYGVMYNKGKVSYTIEEIFSIFIDANKDKKLNWNEFRTLLTMAYNSSPSLSDIQKAIECMSDLQYDDSIYNGTSVHDNGEDDEELPFIITVEEVKRCESIVKGMQHHYR